jgi:hypothetical protein
VVVAADHLLKGAEGVGLGFVALSAVGGDDLAVGGFDAPGPFAVGAPVELSLPAMVCAPSLGFLLERYAGLSHLAL